MCSYLQRLAETHDVRNKPTNTEIKEMYEEDELPPYYVNDDPNSACVTLLSSISLLCRYCQSLYTDLYTIQQPKWFLAKHSGITTKVVIELPTVSPLIERIEVNP